MKVPHHALDHASADHGRLRREAGASALLRHPNIVTLYDLVVEGDTTLLISELVIMHQGSLKRLDPQQGDAVEMPCEVPPSEALVQIDSQHVVASCIDAPAMLIDVDNGRSRQLPVEASGPVRLSSDGRWLLGFASDSGRAWMLETTNWSDPVWLEGHNPRSIALSLPESQVFWHDGNKLLSSRIDESPVPELWEDYPMMPEHLRVSPDGELLAVGLTWNQVQLFDVRTRRQQGPKLMFDGTLHSMQFTPSGRTLITLTEKGVIRMWNVTTVREMVRYRIEPPYIYRDIQVTPDGRHVALLNDLGLTLHRIY